MRFSRCFSVFFFLGMWSLYANSESVDQTVISTPESRTDSQQSLNEPTVSETASQTMVKEPETQPPTDQPPAQPPPSLTVCEKIEQLEKGLAELKSSLQQNSAMDSATQHPNAVIKGSFVKSYMGLFVKSIEERGVDIQQGLRDIASFFARCAHWELSKIFLTDLLVFTLKFLLAFFLSWGIATFTERWLGVLVDTSVFKWAFRELSATPRIQKTFSMITQIMTLVTPPIVHFILQVSFFFVLEHNTVVRSAILSLSVGLLIFNLVKRTQNLFLSLIPSSWLAPNSQKRCKSIQRAVNLFVFSLLLQGWSIELGYFFDFSQEVVFLVLMITGICLTIAGMSVVYTLKHPILRWIKTTQEKQFPFLTTLFWMLWNTFPIILLTLFFFNHEFFNNFLWPLISTIFLLPAVPLLFSLARHLRIIYLMHARRRGPRGVFYEFLRRKKSAYRFFYLLVYGVSSTLLIHIWDLNFFAYLKSALGNQVYEQLADFALLILGAWACIHLGDRILHYYLSASPLEDDADSFYTRGRMRTLLNVSRTILKLIIILTFTLWILVKLDYNIVPILTNLSLFSAVLGFGLQSFIKDFFAGLFSLIDNNVVVGDWVDIDGKKGIVEELNLRTLKVRADNGTLMTMTFGSINVIGNRSRHFSRVLCNLTVPYTSDIDRINQLIEQAFITLKRMSAYRKKLIGSIQIRGVNEIKDYALVFQARIQTQPAEQEFVRRGFNKVWKQLLDQEQIKVPTPPLREDS